MGWAGFVARIAVKVSRPHGAGMHWTLAPRHEVTRAPGYRRRRESQPGALPIIYPRLVDPRRGWHMDERSPGRRRAKGPLHSPPLSNSQGHGQSSCPLGHPPQCPCDGNGLRVIEIRMAPPDTATVVSVAHSERTQQYPRAPKLKQTRAIAPERTPFPQFKPGRPDTAKPLLRASASRGPPAALHGQGRGFR